MRTDYRMLTRHHFWKLLQRLEQLPELWGMYPAEIEALKEKLSNLQGEIEKDKAESSQNRACAAAAEELRIEKGLTRREIPQRGRIPLRLVQGIEDNTLQDSRITRFIDTAPACALSLLLKSMSSFSA